MRGARARTLAMVTLVGLMSLGATEPPKAGGPGASPQEAEVTARRGRPEHAAARSSSSRASGTGGRSR